MLRSLAGIVIGAGAAAGVIWFLLKHSTVGLLSTAMTIVVLALLALLVGITTTRSSGVALFAGGVTLLINDALLAAKFATILGFGHLALTESIGLWPASASIVLAMSFAYLASTVSRKRWPVLVVVALAVVASWPAKLSSHFFI